MKYAYTVTLQWVVGGRTQQTSTRQGTITMPSGATRSRVVAAAVNAAATAMGAASGAVTIFLDVQPDEL
jgi:hypothetical protein